MRGGDSLINNSTERYRFLYWLHTPLTFSLVTLQILAVLGAFEQPAHAYVDPGSGLLAFQILSTTFAGFIFILRRRVHKLFKSIIKGFNPKDEVSTPK